MSLRFSEVEDVFLCMFCLGDEPLRLSLSSYGLSKRACTDCGREGCSVRLDELASFIDDALTNHYSKADNFNHEQYGTDPVGEPLIDIIRREVKPKTEELAEVICQAIVFDWEKNDLAEEGYTDETWFINTGVSNPWLLSRWEEMQTSLKYESRFVNPEAISVLKDVFDGVIEDVTQHGDSLIVHIGPEHFITSLYRARVFTKDELLEDALRNPDDELGPPPPNLATAGRMNAKGISVFYGANNPDVAVAEVRPPVGSKVAVAQFKLLKNLKLLDLTKFKEINPIVERSMFDDATLDKAVRQKFIAQLESQLVLPVMPENVEEGYLITQVIADFLATNRKLDLDGVIFKSIQVSHKLVNNPLNIVLFNKATSIKPVIKTFGRRLHTNLIRWDGYGDSSLQPEIWLPKEEDDKKVYPDNPNNTLELIPDSIVIFDITGVSFASEKYPVSIIQSRY